MPFPPGGQPASLISHVLGQGDEGKKKNYQGSCNFCVNLTGHLAQKRISQGALEAGSFQLQRAAEAELKTLDLLQIPTGFKCLR